MQSLLLCAGLRSGTRRCSMAPKAAPPARTDAPGRGMAASKGPGPSRLGNAGRLTDAVTPRSIMTAVAQQQPGSLDQDDADPLDCPDYYWSDSD